MAYIPSIALEVIIENSKCGVWLDTLHDGAVALVCKIPETAIKALHMGVECSFQLSIVNLEGLYIMCLGLRIEDEPENPFNVIAPNASPSSLASVKRILNSRTTRLHCLNELNHPVLSAWCLLDGDKAQDALNGLSDREVTPITDTREPSEIFQTSERALRLFQKYIYRADKPSPGEMYASIPLTLELWATGEMFEISLTAQGGPFRIDDDDEGWKLEKEAHLCINSLYPGSSSIHRPTRNTGKELIDILSFVSNFICLIESKALSILKADQKRSSWRRASNVDDDISDAIGQLHGALRYIRSGRQVFDPNGVPIVMASRRDLPTHAIILLSEMYAFLDWKLIAREVASASEDERSKALFHVIDLMELTYIAGQSKDSTTFGLLMLQRWAEVKTRGTAYCRALRLPPAPDFK